MQTPSIDWKKYLIAFFISATVFLSAVALSNYFNNKKLDQLSAIQDSISIDLLSSETQYALLGTLDCSQVSPSTVLSDELNELSKKIEYSDSTIGSSAQLTRLKESYSLLEIKDYLLMKELTTRCGQKSVFILYFYTTNDSCADCTKQGYVLTALREKYPALRVYSFDYGLNLSAIETLIKIYHIKDTELPAIVSDKQVYTGFHSVDDFEKLIPKLKDTLPAVDTTATAVTSGAKSTQPAN
jgi:hypothetical protein